MTTAPFAKKKRSTLEPAPVKQVSSADAVFKEVVRGLYEGQYSPGQRLLEADLARIYSVSRGSVREALNRLAAEGIVTLSLYKGAAIRSLTRTDVRNILEVLEMLLGLSGRLAAEKIDEISNRKKLLTVTKRILEFEGNPFLYDLVRARDRFYATLVAIGGNPELARVLASTHVHLVRIQLRSPQIESKRFEDYRLITQAVLAGKAREAELACRRHVREHKKVVEALPDSAFAR
jgi:DNA-binding GntR family transcriptional regulator